MDRNACRLLSIVMQMGLEGGPAQAFMISGLPGAAKTALIKQMAASLEKRLGHPFPAEVWSGPQIQAEDAAGLPVPDLASGTTRLLPLRVGSSVIPAGAGVVVIDEFGSLEASQESAFLNFIQDGRLGEQVLPTGIARGGIGNPEEVASNGRALSAPAANRFFWINWTIETAPWVDYMRGGPGLAADVAILPKNWERDYGPNIRSLMASYIERNPSAMHEMPPPHKAGVAWPSPRSWEAAARIMAAVLSTGENQKSDLVDLALRGCVGDGQADAFMGWLKNMDLPDPEELLAHPDRASKLLPERGDHLSVCLESVAVASLRDHAKMVSRYETAWKIVVPVFHERNDVAFSAMRMLCAHTAHAKLADAKLPPLKDTLIEVMQKAGLVPDFKKKAKKSAA